MYKFLIEVGKKVFGTNSKKIADDLIKQGGKRTTQSKVPEGVTVQRAPTTPNPRTSAGKFTKSQPPARPRADSPATPPRGRTAPAKPSAKAKSPAKPKTQTTAPSKPKVSTKAPKGPKAITSRKPKTMDKSLVKERPNLPPRPKTSRPQALRATAAAGSAPQVETTSVTPPTKASSGPTSRPNNRPSDKTKSSGPTSRPNNRPSDKKKETSARPKARPSTSTKKAAPSKPKADPFANWSAARKKALRSDKIGKDAGDGMKWVVGANSNALVRTRDDSKVKSQLKLKKMLK